MLGASDTSPEVERILIAGYRRMPASQKASLVVESFLTARRMHEAGFRRRNPHAKPEEAHREWVLTGVGPGPWVDKMEFSSMDYSQDQIDAIRTVIAVLVDLNIEYAVGGSYASSHHGIPRYTFDADIAVEPFPGKERLLALNLTKQALYVDEGPIREAVSRRSSFNIIDLKTTFKIDIFVNKKRAYDREIFTRRPKAEVLGANQGLYRVIAAEDSILLKLEWYRLGNEISDQQWKDVLNVMKIQGDNLDQTYLDHWAHEIGVSDLLVRVRADAQF